MQYLINRNRQLIISLLVFFVLARYRVVKIACSSSEVVL
jgi:hypothetical protein